MKSARNQVKRAYRITVLNVETGRTQSQWHSHKPAALACFQNLAARAQETYNLTVLLYGRAGTVIDETLACLPLCEREPVEEFA
jgi:DNA-binding IclR family transcriptional regulator